jgi:2-amino-4-hydroxy-6-hydroxymethyldihydropteridine diphosphokinase
MTGMPLPEKGPSAPPVVLPPWAVVSDKRRAHIDRVTHLLDTWAMALDLDAAERQAWHDAGRWHDALRDCDEPTLRAATGDTASPFGTLHGPAAAIRLEKEGETRADVLDAIRWHTMGSGSWGRTGKALYMADYLEPGRPFAVTDRGFLAQHVVMDFDGVFRQVVRHRFEWTLREGKALFPQAVAMWNAVR